MVTKLERLYWRFPHPLRQQLLRTILPASYDSLRTLGCDALEGKAGAVLLPFVTHRCIFIHITKTAGTSVNAGLFGTRTGSHRKIAHYRAVFDKPDYLSYFKFAFVRNPWDRLVSAYLYLKQGGAHSGDRNWALQHLAPYPTFDDFVRGWVKPGNIRRKNHFVPQVDHICLPGQRRIELDYVGSYENLQADYDTVRAVLGMGKALPVRNVTPGKQKDFRSYYTSETRAIVAEAYREDIERLEYKFYTPTPVTRAVTRPRGVTLTLRPYPARTLLSTRPLHAATPPPSRSKADDLSR